MNRNDKGYILITTLLLMLILTIVGISSIGISTLENALSGNLRLRERNLSKAEGGLDVGYEFVESAKKTGLFTGYTDVLKDTNFLDESSINVFDTDDPINSPDLQFTVDTGLVSVDIDKMDVVTWIPGSSIEFASGYEGPGKGGATTAPAYFRINSVAQGLANSEAEAGIIYIYISPNK